MRQLHRFPCIVRRSKAVRALLLIVLLTGFISAPSSAADIEVTAKLEPARFSENQVSRFVMTVNGAQSAEPDMPVADGLRFVYQGKSSQASWVNGKISSSISFNFIVQAEKSGEFTIAPINVTVGGTIYTSESVSCTVLAVQKSGSRAAASASAKGPADSGIRPGAEEIKNIGFMRIISETERMYSGQVIPFTLKAYFRSGKRVTLKSAPHLNGEDFLLQSLDEEPVQQQERVNGITYTSLTWQGTLSAVKEGTVSLSAAMDAEVLVRSKSRLPGSPFSSSLLDDPFFAGVLGNYSRRDITVLSPEKTVSVLDLPTEKRPDDFSGAIGIFSLAVTASPLDGKVGEPISMKMQLDGSGNFTSVQAPILTEEQGWKIYPASGSVKDLGGGKGAKTFEQALIPTEQGLTAVPSVRFSYFDPKIEEYVTLNSDPIPLHLQAADEDIAAPGNSGSLARVVPQGENKARKDSAAGPGQHLAPLKPELGKLLLAVQPVYEKLWFRLLILTALLCVLLSFALFLRQRKLAKDPSILRRRKMQARLAEQYKGMKQALAMQDQEAFHRHCRAAVQEGAGGAWGLAPEAVTLADLEQRLPTEAPLRTVFARLEQSGYSGEQLPQADLEEILQTVKKELDKLA